MHIAWGSLGLVAVVSLAAAVAVIALVSFALVGLSARARTEPGGPDDGAAPPLSPTAGTAVAAVFDPTSFGPGVSESAIIIEALD